MSVPAFERLRADLGRHYGLAAPSGERFAAELHTAAAGVPMSPDYCCYAARFALPPGVQLPQALYMYTVHAGADAWSLLLTPVGPCSDGRALLEAVFHYPIPLQASAGQTRA